MFRWIGGIVFWRCGACGEYAVTGKLIKLGDVWSNHVKCHACRVRRTFYPSQAQSIGQAADNLKYSQYHDWH